MDAEPVERADEGNVEADAESAAPESSPGPADAESAPETAGEASPEEAAPTGGDEADATASEPTDAVADSEDPFAEEAEWRETVSIPAVDPDESAATEDGEEAADRPAPGSQERQAAAATTGQPRERSRPTEGPSRQELRETLEARTEALAEARERLESATEERDEVAAERDRLRDRVDDLEEEVATLRSDLATRTDDAATETGGVARSPADALAGTDLFVRYGSRGEATLEDVPDGAGSEAVRSNLRLDHHTQFEAEETTVGGDDYEAFLRDTVEYGFVSWLVETLPFEIRETDHEGALRDLYEALPEIDRVEFGGTVSVEDGDDRSFDVVARDRMGGPLVVGDINDRRDPVADEMLTDLVDAASAVAADRDVAGAFYVTASFFEPDALDVAAAATGGGLLSRDKRASYVKESRKRGFHLCLVETRNGSFYLNVPEL